LTPEYIIIFKFSLLVDDILSFDIDSFVANKLSGTINIKTEQERGRERE
jgi:hypothetical protein